MKPHIGQIVTIYGYASNGSEEHPAIVTRVWGRAGDHVTVNLTAFPDQLPPVYMGSIYLFSTRRNAMDYRADTPSSPVVAFLPENL